MLYHPLLPRRSYNDVKFSFSQLSCSRSFYIRNCLFWAKSGAHPERNPNETPGVRVLPYFPLVFDIFVKYLVLKAIIILITY